MKFLLIFLTLVHSSLAFSAEKQNHSFEQVRLKLWYQGVEKDKKYAPTHDLKSKNDTTEIPEELEMAIDKYIKG